MANRFDLHIQSLPAAQQKQTFKFMSFGFTQAVGVKGFQMLINQWLKTLLTPRGSDPVDMDYGTDFPSLIARSFTLADARDIVVLSIDQCNEQVLNFQRNDISLTPSERLAVAELIEFTEKPSDPGFDAVVEIKNQSGEQLRFLLPEFSDV